MKSLEMFLRLPISPEHISLEERLGRIEHRLSILEERRSGVLDNMVLAPFSSDF
ncbi:MAG: hypothetical protein Q8P67_05800 [archaeon]|nr:hypothetical protein [archaeon]